MAMTVRLPADLARRGRRYADEVGVSLNALLAIALREYLDVRAPTATVSPSSAALAQAIARRVRAGPVRQKR
jgi:predicted transcriptional regulator